MLKKCRWFLIYSTVLCCVIHTPEVSGKIDNDKEDVIGTFVDLYDFNDSINLYRSQGKIIGMSSHIGWFFQGCLDESLKFCLKSSDFGVYLAVPNIELDIDVKWSYSGQEFKVIAARYGLFLIDCCVRKIRSNSYTQRFVYSEITGVIAFMYGVHKKRCNSCFDAKSYFSWSGEKYPDDIFRR